MMYQRILVPIDGSATAERALQEAIRLAGSEGELRLVYVIEGIYPLDAEGISYIDYPALQKAVRHTGERILAAAEKKCGSQVRKWLLLYLMRVGKALHMSLIAKPASGRLT